MATVTVLGTPISSTTAGDKAITATPAQLDLIVVVTVCTGIAGGTTGVTDTAGGTYVQAGVDRTGFSTTGVLDIWVRTAAFPSATSTTFTAAQAGSTGGGLCVLGVGGMLRYGTGAVRSTGGQSTAAAGTPAPVLSNTPLTTNPIILAVGNGTNSTTTVVPRASFTEACDLGYNTPACGFEVCYRASGETTATQTFGGASASIFASIGVELDASSPFPSGPVLTSTRRRAAHRFMTLRNA